MHKTDILEVVSRKLAPFVLLFGCYLIAYGHLSPGGGFQGGVVLASGIILLILGCDAESIQEIFPLKAIGFVEVCGFLGFLLIGLLGLVFSTHFLKNFLPLAGADELPRAGFIFLLNTIIGLKVGAGMTLLCFYLLKDDVEDSA